MHVIGIDLGGTKISAALFNKNGQMTHPTSRIIEKQDREEVGKQICEQIIVLIKKADQKKSKIQAIGICIPGIYFSKNGHVWAPNIPGWENYPLLEEISSLPVLKDIPVLIDSDRACYILGETWLGTAKGCKNAIFLAVGTGIGAGILVDGHILRGHSDIAGAIGWLALDRPYEDDYIQCGCFEHHASGEGLGKIARKFLTDHPEYKGTFLNKPFAEISSYDVFTGYSMNDPIAKKVIENAIQFWGMAVANLVSLFNPEKIVFGGGVFGPAAQFIDAIHAEAKKWAQPVAIKHVKIEPSILSGNAGLIGAARLAFNSEL